MGSKQAAISSSLLLIFSFRVCGDTLGRGKGAQTLCAPLSVALLVGQQKRLEHIVDSDSRHPKLSDGWRWYSGLALRPTLFGKPIKLGVAFSAQRLNAFWQRHLLWHYVISEMLILPALPACSTAAVCPSDTVK
jgi:hypothetical protein